MNTGYLITIRPYVKYLHSFGATFLTKPRRKSRSQNGGEVVMTLAMLAKIYCQWSRSNSYLPYVTILTLGGITAYSKSNQLPLSTS